MSVQKTLWMILSLVKRFVFCDLFMRILFCLQFLLLFAVGNAQDSATVKKRKNSFVFDVNAGPLVNNAFSNFNPNSDYTRFYSETPGTQIRYGLNGGTEFLWSRRPDMKFLLGLSYTLTHSDFREDYDISPGTSHSGTTRKHIEWQYSYQALDLAFGFRISPVKKLQVSLALAYSYVFSGKEQKYGYYSEFISYYPYPNYYDTASYNGTVELHNRSYLSWRVKLAYDFNIKNVRLAVFTLFNWGLVYKLPYIQAGLQWYPFRKMQ